ncbi:MAG: hypothetical protein ACLQO6_13085 [Desulfomonilaceae bacterium]
MTKVGPDEYAVVIRHDYYNALNQLAENTSDQDRLIQEAIEMFLTNYTFEQREIQIETEEPRLRIFSHAPSDENNQPSSLYLQYVHLPDDFVNHMRTESRYLDTQSYHPLDTVLNAAVRILLVARGHYQWPETPQQ